MSGHEPSPFPAIGGSAEPRSRLADASGLVVGLDFDGTLAPIADDPDAPTITPRNRRALSEIAARPDATVAVISGRGLSDLRGRVGVDDVVYAGNHGMEISRDGETTVHPAAEAHRPAIERACREVGERVGDVPGCEIEDKGPTATVHYRGTPSDRVDEVRAAVSSVVDDVDGDGVDDTDWGNGTDWGGANGPADGTEGLRRVPGKQSIEIRPDVDWDKGSAMDLLADAAPAGWRSVYVGDDTTDEDAFRAVAPDGLGVLVGAADDAIDADDTIDAGDTIDAEDTAAACWLSSQSDVAPFVEWLRAEILAEGE